MQRKLCMISRASGDCPSLARQVKFPGKIFEKIYIEKLQSVCDERLGGLVRITTNSLYIYSQLPTQNAGRPAGLMVSGLNSRASGPGLSPGREHCVAFLGKTLYSHSTSLQPSV